MSKYGLKNYAAIKGDASEQELAAAVASIFIYVLIFFQAPEIARFISGVTQPLLNSEF
jgi:hypothetical protein